MEPREYEMSQEQLARLLHAIKRALLTPAIALQCGLPESPQQVANRKWRELGDEMGFDYMTVKPSAKGMLFFTAIPRSN